MRSFLCTNHGDDPTAISAVGPCQAAEEFALRWWDKYSYCPSTIHVVEDVTGEEWTFAATEQRAVSLFWVRPETAERRAS